MQITNFFTEDFFTFAQVAGKTVEAPLMSQWLTFLFVILIVVLPFVVGALAARALQMKEYALKFGIALFAITLGTTPFVSQYVIGGLESSKHDKDMTAWKKKQEYRDKIPKADLDALKKALPNVEIFQETPESIKAPEVKKTEVKKTPEAGKTEGQ